MLTTSTVSSYVDTRLRTSVYPEGCRVLEADKLRTIVDGADDPNPLTALAAVRQLHQEADRLEALMVRKARVADVSWAAIAMILGVSRQAVHRKYGGARFGNS